MRRYWRCPARMDCVDSTACGEHRRRQKNKREGRRPHRPDGRDGRAVCRGGRWWGWRGWGGWAAHVEFAWSGGQVRARRGSRLGSRPTVLGTRISFMTELVVGDWYSLGSEGRTRDHTRDPNSGGRAYMGGGQSG